MAKNVKKSKRFRYNLETLLKVRHIREKQAQDKFNELERAYQEELKKEEELKAEQNAAYQELHHRMAEGDISDMNDIQIRKHHLEKLGEKVVEQEQVRENAHEAMEKQREEMIQAVKERKVIERDKENTREAWKKLMDKEAGKFLDEITVVKYAKIDPENLA